MKQVITNYEQSLLDGLGVMADGNREQRRQIALQIERLLLVDSSRDRTTRIAIENWVMNGADVPLEQFLLTLGIDVHDPVLH